MHQRLVSLKSIFLNRKTLLFLGLFILAVFCISQQQLFKNINLSNSDNVALASPGCNPDNCAVYGTICCSGSDNCINWTNDNNNCGGCGIRCINGQTCVYNSSNQTARCICQESNCNYYGTTCCNNQCANTFTDPNNCGSCGNRCISGQTCQSGSCICLESNCNYYGATCCNNQCANLYTDANNCGSCGNRCGTGYRCSNAQCVDGSPPAINITSPSNNATVSGTVDIKADASDPQSSVEWVRFTVKKTTSPTGTQICEDTSFPYTCSWDTTGFADGSYYVYASARSAGGESIRMVSVKVQNGSPAVCDPQACAVYGTICCTGSTQCINWTNDPNNCGGCGIKCAAGQTCVYDAVARTASCQGGGGCNPQACAVYGTICCTGSTQCINWTNDPNNCGGCGKKCTAGQTCTTSGCTGGGCTNDCSTSGAKRCDPSNNTRYQICGQYDTDKCLDWSLSMACPSSQTCSETGTCGGVTCNCTWVNQGCGGADCPKTQRGQTRSCPFTGCQVETRCLTDSVCAASIPSPATLISPIGNASNIGNCVPEGAEVTFSWTLANPAGQTVQAQWFDLTTNNGIFTEPCTSNAPPYSPTGCFVHVQLNNWQNSYIAKAGNPLTLLKPGTKHWWRINTKIGGEWYSSNVAAFTTNSCGALNCPSAYGRCEVSTIGWCSPTTLSQYFHNYVCQASAICYQESTGIPWSQNPTSGARGLFQILQSTAQSNGLDYNRLLEPVYNIQGAVKISSDGLWWQPWAGSGNPVGWCPITF